MDVEPTPLRRRARDARRGGRGARAEALPSAAGRCASASTAPSPNRAWRGASSTPSAPTPGSPSCSFPGRRWRCSRRCATARSTSPSSTRPAPRTRSKRRASCTTGAGSRRASSSWSGRRRRACASACRRRAGAASKCSSASASRPRPTRPASSSSSANDGSGVHVAEQALWRAARIEPVAPWYVGAEPDRPFTAQVRARGAYALVERGAWTAAGGAPLVVLAEGDPLLVESIHAMRSFRVSHPAAKIFIAWIAGGRGARGRRPARRLPAALRPPRDGAIGTAAEPQRRPRERGLDQRPARDDRDRQARGRGPARRPAARHRRRRAGRPVGARRAGQGGLRLSERALRRSGRRCGRRPASPCGTSRCRRDRWART